ncbi:MAG: hypothetical protein C4313_00765 [Thermoflexus sp.]|uniref:mechanosensitive ion channel family protein n=1 Tax=Thermoflexus sp. TaxID=1969742 RepID=UPI0033206F80
MRLDLWLRLVLLLALVGVAWWAAGKIHRLCPPGLDPERARRLEALLSLGRSLLRALVLAVAFLIALDLFGLNLGPLLTGAGIVGVILGLGAQSVIRDLIAGVVLVLEGPFGIGEVIHAAGVGGTVERITLRATYLRDADGTLHAIPNSMLGVISNLSRDWARVAADLPLPRATPWEHVEAIRSEAEAAMAQDETLAGSGRGPLTIAGVEGISETAFVVRFEIPVHPAARWTAARRLRYHLIRAARTLEISPIHRQEA